MVVFLTLSKIVAKLTKTALPMIMISYFELTKVKMFFITVCMLSMIDLNG